MTRQEIGILLLAGGVFVGPWFYRRFLQVDGNPEPEIRIRVGEIPRLFHALKTAAAESSYAGVIVPPLAKRNPMESAYVQFSIGKGRVGLDWVLESQQNIEDRHRFDDVAQSLGHRVEEHEMNEVKYLRVEEGDLPRLATSLLERLYGLQDQDELRVQLEGFSWSVPDAAV